MPDPAPVPAPVPTLAERLQQRIKKSCEANRFCLEFFLFAHAHEAGEDGIKAAIQTAFENVAKETRELLAELTPEPVRPTPVNPMQVIAAGLKDRVRQSVTDPVSAPPTCDLTTLEWAEERLANTYQIAKTTMGADRNGWLEDQRYWTWIVDGLNELNALGGRLDELKAENARLDELANDRGTEVIRLKAALADLKTQLSRSCSWEDVDAVIAALEDRR